MREVASFMQMYPAYKLRDVLDEYAVTFFTLLNDGYRIRYEHYRMLAQIALTPAIRDRDRTRFLDQLDRASRGFDDILNPSEGTASPDELKKLLG